LRSWFKDLFKGCSEEGPPTMRSFVRSYGLGEFC